LFPYLPGQSGYNKRLRKSAVQIQALIRMLGQDTDVWADDTWLIDSTPVETARSRPTVKRTNLAGWAGYGYCASHSRILLRAAPASGLHTAGLPITFALTNPKADERDIALDMFDHDPTLFDGAASKPSWPTRDTPAASSRPASPSTGRTDPTGTQRAKKNRSAPDNSNRSARIVESVFDTLK